MLLLVFWLLFAPIATTWQSGAVIVRVAAPVGCLWLEGPARESVLLPNSCDVPIYKIPSAYHPLPGDWVTLVRDVHRDSAPIPPLSTYLPLVLR